MKQIFFILALFAIASCTEIPPVVTPSMNTGGTCDAAQIGDQDRNVLVEEFTGVRCVNCPAGSRALQDLIDNNNHRVIAVSIHAGSQFSPPLPESNYDFRTPAGDELLNFLGQPFGYPSAVISRKESQQDYLHYGLNDWAGAIATDLATAPKAKMLILPSYDATTRELSVELSVEIVESLEGQDVRLSIMLAESGIVDAQDEQGVGIVLDYEHNHVLRGMLTPFTGSPITESLAAGSAFCRPYTFSMPSEWNADNCTIIAFTHLAGDSKEVLQAVEAKVN